MSEALKIALTALLGVVVFVIGQIAVKFLIEPLHDQKKLIGEISGTIIFYSNVGAGVEQHYLRRNKGALCVRRPSEVHCDRQVQRCSQESLGQF